MRGTRVVSQRGVSLLYIVVVVLIALTIRAFIAEPTRVDGDSMIPTLVHNEDMLVEKMTYWFSDPLRGDIVICFYPGYTESCVKRVIGLPGETVAVKDGVITINGKPIDESAYWKGEIIGDMDPVTVGDAGGVCGWRQSKRQQGQPESFRRLHSLCKAGWPRDCGCVSPSANIEPFSG